MSCYHEETGWHSSPVQWSVSCCLSRAPCPSASAGMRFLVDTGASDVVFTRDDARRLGIDPAQLDFSEKVMTANGVVSAAPVKLATLTIGPITVHDLDALISDGEQDVSLLGMRFIQTLD